MKHLIKRHTLLRAKQEAQKTHLMKRIFATRAKQEMQRLEQNKKNNRTGLFGSLFIGSILFLNQKG